jgi:hypothetical protein
VTEILVSLTLLLLITVADLRLLSVYLQADKANYYRTVEIVKVFSLAERSSLRSRVRDNS